MDRDDTTIGGGCEAVVTDAGLLGGDAVVECDAGCFAEEYRAGAAGTVVAFCEQLAWEPSEVAFADITHTAQGFYNFVSGIFECAVG